MIDPEQKRAVLEKFAKFAFIAVGLAVTAPLAMYALEGLIMWTALGLGVAVVVNFAPAFATWLANKKIQALKAVIEANPIESMEGLYNDKKSELNSQYSAVEEVATQYKNVEGLVKGLLKTDPEEAKDYVEIKDKLKEGLDEIQQEYDAASIELAEFYKQIDKARRIWKVQIAINKALDVSAAARSAVFADIKKQVAFDKVTNDLNRAFARLDTAVQRRKSGTLYVKAEAIQPKQLTEGTQGDIIDAQKVSQRISVPR